MFHGGGCGGGRGRGTTTHMTFDKYLTTIDQNVIRPFHFMTFCWSQYDLVTKIWCSLLKPSRNRHKRDEDHIVTNFNLSQSQHNDELDSQV